MELVGKAISALVLLFIFAMGVAAIFRGRKGMKMSKSFEGASKKMRVGYMIASAAHMCFGSLIVICYLIAIIFMMLSTGGAA